MISSNLMQLFHTDHSQYDTVTEEQIVAVLREKAMTTEVFEQLKVKIISEIKNQELPRKL